MGWTSWSFLRGNPTEASVEAQAQALHDSHLSDHGYVYVNVDDYYYDDPSKMVDSYGRWVVDPTRFPSGMAATAGSATQVSATSMSPSRVLSSRR